MIREVHVDSWSDFQENMHERMIRDAREVHYGMYYRGQPDASWPIATTLERFVRPCLSVATYYRMIDSIRPTLETFTGRKWELPSQELFLSDPYVQLLRAQNGVREYMAYLRHYGYPSPFLDWSHSPFVAAYFAFRDASSSAKSVSIFSFMEVGDEVLGEKPQIMPVFATGSNNKRYFLQQSALTVCLQTNGNQLCFCPHENPRSLAEGSCVIEKYILPAAQRPEALQSLESYNINAFSLMGSDESLLEKLFLEQYLKASRASSYFGQQAQDGGW